MKRLLLLAFIAILLAGALGTLVAQDPGYALIAYGGYAVQTSLWVLLCLLLLSGGLLYGVRRLYRALRGMSVGYASWWEGYQASRNARLREEGMALLLSGDYRKARRQLAGDKSDGFAQGLGYLAAARAADEAGDAEARERCLRLAGEASPALARACQVAAAELALNRGDAAACLAALDGLAASPHLAALRRRAQSASGAQG